MPSLRPVSLFLLCTLSSACEPESFVCTDQVVPSVRSEVVDGQGTHREARVTFTVDGGPEQQAQCMTGRSPQHACGLWEAGMEQTGLFLVTVTSLQGSSTQSQHALVTKDVCHVRTQRLTFTLPD